MTGELQVEAPPRVEGVSPSKIRTKSELGLVLLVSAVILIPCFWQRHIQAGDLASHVSTGNFSVRSRTGKGAIMMKSILIKLS